LAPSMKSAILEEAGDIKDFSRCCYVFVVTFLARRQPSRAFPAYAA
jgi:hypothetical protein